MEPVTSAVFAKISEQIERTIHLIGLVPENRLEWTPPIDNAMSFGELFGHLFDCLAGFCAVLQAAHPDRLAHFAALRDLPVNRPSGPAAAGDRIEVYRSHVEEGFAALRDADMGRKLPTVFVPSGEAILTLLLGNLEHLINHKYQLFLYLKLARISVGTPDLYRLRQ